MYSTFLALALAVLFMDSAILVHAELFVVQPFKGSTCAAGQQCTISWVDDGIRPLLSAIGVSTVGLYTGKQQLVQSINPVDVTETHSVTFTPNAAAGPNSDSYYIALVSTTLKGNDSIPYSAYSPFFQLTGMSGSFESPLPAATSSIPIPASLSRTPSATPTPATITVGTLSTAATLNTVPTTRPSSSSSSSSSSRSTSSSASKLLTSIVSSPSPTTPVSQSQSSSSASSSTSPTSATSHTSGAVGGASNLPAFLPMLTLASITLALFS